MRSLCPECGASRGLRTFSDGTWCYACHKLTKYKKIVEIKQEKPILTIPEQTREIPYTAQQWLNQYYITLGSVDITWSYDYERICFPYNNNQSCWMRTLDKTKKDKWVFVGEKALYWLNYDIRINKKYEAPKHYVLVVTEDVISAIRCNEFLDSVALGGTNVQNKDLLPILLQYDTVILWLDGDKAGYEATENFIKRYKHLRPIKVIHTPKDPKCYSSIEMEKIINDL